MAALSPPINLFETSYFLSREIVANTKSTGMAHWCVALFAILFRNVSSIEGLLPASQQMGN